MKNIINKIFLFAAFALVLGACGEEDYETYNEGEIQSINDAFLQIATQVISFQAGTPSYEIDLNLVNGDRKVTKVNVYSTFTDATSGVTADEVLFKAYNIGDDNLTRINESFTYEDIKSGITINGAALPADDLALAIGSGWKLRFEGETAQGVVGLGGAINVAVLSRFAGLYRVVASDYYRINVQSGSNDWSGDERFIGSVDETTFSYNDYWAVFGWGGNSFTFSIDSETNLVTVPLLTEDGLLANGDPLFSGNRGLGCHTEPGMFVDVPCEGSNILVVDDVDGRHRIFLTYGYFTDGSGSRQFYEELEKIVD